MLLNEFNYVKESQQAQSRPGIEHCCQLYDDELRMPQMSKRNKNKVQIIANLVKQKSVYEPKNIVFFKTKTGQLRL